MSKLSELIRKKRDAKIIKEKLEKMKLSLEEMKKYVQEPIQGKYNIPIKYIEAEAPILQEDRCRIYSQMNNKIDKEIGETLQQLYDYRELGYAIGIHRTANMPSETFYKGIICRGNTFADHVQRMDNLPLMLREMSHCEGYKLSRGCFISIVPKASILKLKDHEKEKLKSKYMEVYKDKWEEEYNKIITPQPIFYKDKDDNIYLRPEFVNAYVPVSNKELKNVEFNTNSHNIYDATTEFLYEEDILEKNKSYGFANIILISILLIVITIFLILK